MTSIHSLAVALALLIVSQGAAQVVFVERKVDFEDAPPGPFTEFDDGAGGSWVAREGHAEIHTANRRSGAHALRLFGGDDRVVEYGPWGALADMEQLSFWTERWTRRSPFEFRVEAATPDGWIEVYDGDDTIAIGGFYTHVRIALPEEVLRLRFQCTSPEGSGVIIDDLRLGPTTSAPDPIDDWDGVAIASAVAGKPLAHRIPGLVTTNDGSLIAVYDVRHHGWGDLPGDIDVGMRRSTDGGRTWSPVEIIMDMGDDASFNHDGIGDPAILVDEGTGTIWVAATWSHGNRSWRGSGPGLEPEETGQFILVRSDDDGLTWSEPINITKQVKKPQWCFLLAGPGRGITMQDGTIVFAAQYQDTPENNRLPRSTILYSRDHGSTWHLGTGAYDDTTEAQVAEIEPGVLMLNCRYNRTNTRVVMITHDMGATWEEHPTSREALVEPRACMASLITTSRDGVLLFSNPAVDAPPRRHMTIKASVDNGLTWNDGLLLDEMQSAGYSCLTMIDDDTVGILYESSAAHLVFQRVPLDELLGDVE